LEKEIAVFLARETNYHFFIDSIQLGAISFIKLPQILNSRVKSVL